MTRDSKERLETLRQTIRDHDYRYYVLAQPTITDSHYDALLRELQEIEARHPDWVTPDSPTQRVAGQPSEGFATVEHAVAMLSIDNTYSADELRAFDERIRRALPGESFDYAVEPKIDGLAINLRYERGVLQSGATRGDGQRGDDVTTNIRTIRSIPLRLRSQPPAPERLEVRGEIFLSYTAFQQLNARRAEAGQPVFANPRNAAAGSLKLLDARVTAERGLSFCAYGLGLCSEPVADTHIEAMQRVSQWGLPISPHLQVASDIDQVIDLCLDWTERRDHLDYPIDGMVIKVNPLGLHDRLGVTGRAPRWCIAYKFPAAQARTVIESIDIQVGKSAILTPVANLRPVPLGGTLVKRASLHNFDEIDRLGVRCGDTVIVEKAGEIIPKVMEVVVEARPAGSRPFVRPTHCPVCRHPVMQVPGEVALRCPNPACPAVARGLICHYASRNCMDIEGLGEKVVDQLLEAGLVSDPADLYDLRVDQIAALPRQGQTSAENLVVAIEQSKQRDLPRLLCALAIPHVGEETALILARHFGSLEALQAAGLEDFLDLSEQRKAEHSKIPGIGPVVARAIVTDLGTPEKRRLIERLRAAGVNTRLLNQTSTAASGPFSGKSLVVTGRLERFTRKEIQEAIRQAGGKVGSSVSRKTDYLIVGADPGGKLTKAQELGVTVLTEQQFLERLQSGATLEETAAE